MKIAFFDCFSGISGDMILGALIDAGVKPETLKTELSKLKLDSEFTLSVERCSRHNITGTQVIVEKHDIKNASTDQPTTSAEKSDEQSSSDGDTHDAQHRVCAERGHAPSRNLSDIFAILDNSDLEGSIVNQAKRIFDALAEAESKIHNTSKDAVHLHEVSGIDSIVDVVATVVALHLLGIEEIYASPLALGSGFVRCSHGSMPVPAPGTMELLKGVEVRQTQIRKELVTPTGAAIITTLARRFGPMPEMVIDQIGYGAGARNLDEQPNLLRICVGKHKRQNLESDEVYMIETNLDDMSPEVAGYLMEKLFASRALDVFLTPVFMKKGRAATKLSILAETDLRETMIHIVLTETTTFGVRCYKVQRSKLARDSVEINTKWGPVGTKRGFIGDELVKTVPEYEDCKRIAERHSVPLRKVYDEVLKNIPEVQNAT